MNELNRDVQNTTAIGSASVRQASGHYEVTCVLACLAWIALSATRVSFAMLVSSAHTELNLSVSQMGLVMAAGNIAFIVFAIPAGLIADRVGSNWSLPVGLWMAALSNGLRYFSDDVSLLVGGGVIEAIAFGMLSVVLVKAVMPKSMLARGAIIGSTICVAPLIGSLVISLYGLLLGSEIHWKVPVAALTGLFVLLAVIASAAMRSDAKSDDDNDKLADSNHLPRAIPIETLLLLISAHALLAVVVAGATTFGVSLLLRKYDASLASVSVSMGMSALWFPSILGMVGGIVAGWHCTKQNWRAIPLLMCIAAGIIFLGVLLGTVSPVSLASFGFQLARVALLFSFAAVLTLIACTENRRQIGLLAGVTFACAYLAMLLGPLLIGTLSDLVAIKGSGEGIQSAMWYSLLLIGLALVHLALARHALIERTSAEQV